MSINAIVETVYHYEDGSGKLKLTGEERGQDSLLFDRASHDVTALNGRQIWGGDGSILVGEVKIANRIGYTKIEFVVGSVSKAVAEAERQKLKRKVDEILANHPAVTPCPECGGQMIHTRLHGYRCFRGCQP